MLEDAINQAGINSDTKKYIKLGLNADA
jgi:hypothetical protein